MAFTFIHTAGSYFTNVDASLSLLYFAESYDSLTDKGFSMPETNKFHVSSDHI